MCSNTIRWAWVGLLGHDSSILTGCADWWTNHRKYYWVMPYSHMVTVVLHIPLAIYSVSTGPGPRPLQSNRCGSVSELLLTGLGPCVALPLLSLLISFKPHCTSATKKTVIDVTASMGRISYVIIERSVHVCAIFHVKKLANRKSNAGAWCSKNLRKNPKFS